MFTLSLHSTPMRPLSIMCFLLSGLGALAVAKAQSFCAGLASYPVKPLIGGKAFDLCKPDDASTRAVLVVNTASRCGYTPQYAGLEQLHQRFKNQGLRVLAIPANDFGAQEKGSNQDIAAFCQINYGVSFTVASKLQTAIARDPLFARLSSQTGKAPAWNFHKYLIDRRGRVQSFGSGTDPLSQDIVSAVTTALRP